MKTLPYDALLAMDEATICEVFPLGAVEWKGRWRPATEGQKADRELAKLLKDKKSRIEKPRYLPADASRPPTDNVEMALGLVTPRTRLNERRVEPEPQMIDKVTERRFVEQNREKDQALKENRPLWEMLRELEGRMSDHRKASIRRRIEAARRASNKRAA